MPSPIPTRGNNVYVTKTHQRAIVAALMQVGTYKAAASMIGIEPHSITRWCKKDPEFARLCDEAIDHYDKYVIGPELKAHIHQRAQAGKDDPQSAILAMFSLKKIDPRYRDNAANSLTISGPVAVQFNLSASLSSAPSVSTRESVPTRESVSPVESVSTPETE